MNYLKEFILIGFFSGLLYMIRNFLSDLPQKLHDVKMEGIKNENAKQLQIDSFYRQTSNEQLMKTLSDWIRVIINPENMSKIEPEGFVDMLSNVVLYGSDKSLSRMADFQQYMYKIKKEKSNDSKTDQGIITMYLASFVVAQLKEDFTGYKIDSEELLRTKLTDYDDKTCDLERCKKVALNERFNKN